MARPSPRLLAAPGLLVLLSILAAGCSEQGSAPATSTALSVEEYAAWCGAGNAGIGAGSATTSPGGVAEALAEIWGVSPPPELRGFHRALTRNGLGIALFLEELGAGDALADEGATELWAQVLARGERALEREVAALPQVVRATLEEAGCLWREFGAGVPRPAPRLAAEAGETPVAVAPAGPTSWRTLELVIARDELRCGVKQTQPLFGFREADGTVTGFDIEFCKALAAAVLRDHAKVEYVDASDASTRFELLASGDIDVLIRTTTLTASRDRGLGIDYADPTFYTGQGFAVRTDSGINSTSDMGDATICVQAGTTNEQNVADHFTDIGLDYDPQGGLSRDVADAFFSGRCDVLTSDTAALASRIAVRDDAADYVILSQVISKEPLAPGVRDYDSEWKDVVNWVVHGLIRAEEIGITQANVGQMAANPPNAEVARLLGVPFEGGAVATLGFDRVDPQFIQRAIAAVGNYGEIYDRTIGDNIPRACTLNDLVINNAGCPDGQGGIMYALPYR